MKKLSATFLLVSLCLSLTACSQPTSANISSSTAVSGGSSLASTQTAQSISKSPAQTPTAHNFAATPGGGGPQPDPLPSGLTNPNGNSFVIYAPTDRPVALIQPTSLNVPLRSKGVIYITNDSDSPQTLVSDTPHGWQPFIIHPHSYILLTFKLSTSVTTFGAHLKDFPNVRITISIPALPN